VAFETESATAAAWRPASHLVVFHPVGSLPQRGGTREVDLVWKPEVSTVGASLGSVSIDPKTFGVGSGVLAAVGLPDAGLPLVALAPVATF
jgi:hypothetical protein